MAEDNEGNRLSSRCPVCGSIVSRYKIVKIDDKYRYQFYHGDMDYCQETVRDQKFAKKHKLNDKQPS